MILSNKPITNALIRLRRCAGWPAPLLFANLRRQVFSRGDPYEPVSSIRYRLVCVFCSAKIQISLHIHTVWSCSLSFPPEEMLDPWLPVSLPIKLWSDCAEAHIPSCTICSITAHMGKTSFPFAMFHNRACFFTYNVTGYIYSNYPTFI